MALPAEATATTTPGPLDARKSLQQQHPHRLYTGPDPIMTNTPTNQCLPQNGTEVMPPCRWVSDLQVRSPPPE